MNVALILLAGIVGFWALPLVITIITWNIMYLDPANSTNGLRFGYLATAIVFMSIMFKLLVDNGYKRWL